MALQVARQSEELKKALGGPNLSHDLGALLKASVGSSEKGDTFTTWVPVTGSKRSALVCVRAVRCFSSSDSQPVSDLDGKAKDTVEFLMGQHGSTLWYNLVKGGRWTPILASASVLNEGEDGTRQIQRIFLDVTDPSSSSSSSDEGSSGKSSDSSSGGRTLSTGKGCTQPVYSKAESV